MVFEAMITSSADQVRGISLRLLGSKAAEDLSSGAELETFAECLRSFSEVHGAVSGKTSRFEFVRSEDQCSKLGDRLLDANRRRPAIVLSTRRGAFTARATSLDAGEVASDSAGMASVYVLASDWTRTLSRRLGNKLAVYGGAVRIYHPGLQPYGPSGPHRLYMTGMPTDESRRRSRLSVQWAVAKASVKLFDAEHDPEIYQALDSEVAALTAGAGTDENQWQAAWTRLARLPGTLKARIVGLRSLLPQRRQSPGDAEVKRLGKRLESSQKTVRTLKKRLTNERRHSAKLKKKIGRLEEELRRSKEHADKLHDALGQHNLPGTWDEMIGWCEHHLADRLMLMPRAQHSLRGAQYEKVPAVASGLNWLAKHYRNSRLSGHGGELRGPIQGTSGIRNERCGSDSFAVDWQGQRHQVEWHLRKGDRREPRHCLRIYYFWDESIQQVVIADLPAHRDSPHRRHHP